MSSDEEKEIIAKVKKMELDNDECHQEMPQIKYLNLNSRGVSNQLTSNRFDINLIRNQHPQEQEQNQGRNLEEENGKLGRPVHL